MSSKNAKYICINCGCEVKSLFKKYSESVLKLSDCENCNNVADKYVEYDIVIIIIDLVLLQYNAYRHILFNVDLKNFWKISIILLLMEAYSKWMYNSSEYYERRIHINATENSHKPNLDIIDIELSDFQFYGICLLSTLKNAYYILILYLLTLFYCKLKGKACFNITMIWKALTVSSFGIFLLVPSLIWDFSVREYHLSVVVLYTTMSQLIAYTVMCNCSKIWSVFAISSAYYCKTFHFESLEFQYLK